MALFRKRDAAKNRLRQDADALAVSQARTSYDFHQDKQLAYSTYQHLMECEALRPRPYGVVMKDILDGSK